MSTEKKELPFPLCQASWAKVLKIGEEDNSKSFGTLFYKNLFEAAPILKETHFYKVNTAVQSMNLQGFITTALSILDDMPKAVEARTQLGLRHVFYGTLDAQYEVVGGIVVKTLKDMLGDDLTEEAVAEWVALYGVIQKTCIDAANSERAIPFWKRLYKKRGGEMKTLLQGVETTEKTGVATADVNAAVETLATEQSMAGFEKIAAKLSAEQLKNFGANLLAAVEAKKTVIPYENHMVLQWVGNHLNELIAKNKKFGCCGCPCSGTKCCWIATAAVVAAVGAAAYFFLKKKN